MTQPTGGLGAHAGSALRLSVSARRIQCSWSADTAMFIGRSQANSGDPHGANEPLRRDAPLRQTQRRSRSRSRTRARATTRSRDRLNISSEIAVDLTILEPNNSVFLRELEAPPGFEPGVEVLQTSALPLGDG